MSETKFKGPGWPDFRGWVAFGFFGLTFYALRMIEKNPVLLANASFMQVLSTLLAGGVLLIAMNLFGGTRSGTATNDKLADALTAGATPPAAPKDPAP
ncbi:MAG TPA: hypothetical protein VF474_16920 [Phenylobacterium sp.]